MHVHKGLNACIMICAVISALAIPTGLLMDPGAPDQTQGLEVTELVQFEAPANPSSGDDGSTGAGSREMGHGPDPREALPGCFCPGLEPSAPEGPASAPTNAPDCDPEPHIVTVPEREPEEPEPEEEGPEPVEDEPGEEEPPVDETTVPWHRELPDFGTGVTEPVADVERSLEVPGPPVKLDVLFCLDTTGSMGDEIQKVKDTILVIAETVAGGDPEPYVRYGLVIYRDVGDIYTSQVYDFMDVDGLASIIANVSASGGGDYEESVSEGLCKAVNDVSWNLKDAYRAIYLIGDAPPHTDYDNGYDYLEAARDATEKGIVIHAIGCSGIAGNEDEFKAVAELTGGIFVYLEYSGGSGGSGGGTAPGGIGSGEGTGCGCGSGDSNGGSDNNLDDVLSDLIKDQARQGGVTYDDEEEEEEEDEGTG